ncbi:MAG: hypothetical protein ACRD1V_18665 [Vicinamibacterales bacterium]
MLRMVRHIVLAAAALAVAAAPAAAQAQASAEFDQTQLPGWTVTPGVVFGVMHDSNVALAAPSGPTHQTASDQLFDVEPYGQAEYFSPRTEFFSGYRGFVRRYQTLGALDSVDQTAYSSMREHLTRRVTIYANDSYLRMPTTDDLQLNDVPFERVGSNYNAFAGGVQARLSRTTDLTAQYDLTWVRFNRAPSLLSGGTVNGARADLVHDLTARVGVGAEYTLRVANVNFNTHLLTFHEAGAIVRYRFGPDTSLEVAGGISHLIDAEQQLTRTGPYVTAELTQRERRVALEARYERRFTPSLSFGGSNQSQEASGDVRMPIARRGLYLEANVAWRATDPILPEELPLNSVWVRATGGYAVQRWIRLEVYDEYSRQNTHLAGGQVDRMIVGVQFVVAQPLRIQ